MSRWKISPNYLTQSHIVSFIFPPSIDTVCLFLITIKCHYALCLNYSKSLLGVLPLYINTAACIPSYTKSSSLSTLVLYTGCLSSIKFVLGCLLEQRPSVLKFRQPFHSLLLYAPSIVYVSLPPTNQSDVQLFCFPRDGH